MQQKKWTSPAQLYCQSDGETKYDRPLQSSEGTVNGQIVSISTFEPSRESCMGARHDVPAADIKRNILTGMGTLNGYAALDAKKLQCTVYSYKTTASF